MTKTQRRANEVSTTLGLLAEIILITTSRQATRMFFPLIFLATCYNDTVPAKNKEILRHFNTTGAGGYALYKHCSKTKWMINGGFTEEKGGQVVFHCIFGSFKEDFGVLSSITDVANWSTRQDLGKSFSRGEHHDRVSTAKLPTIKYYSKMSCANHCGILTGVYNQIASAPVFSGKRTHLFGVTFFEHIEKKNMVLSSGKTLPQINASLSLILEDLHQKLKMNKGKLEIGTVEWRTTDKLDFGTPGEVVTFEPTCSGQYFMGKRLSL